jgi:hypothetical protein
MAAAWSAAAVATGDDTDLIDEDELLAEEDRAKKEASSDCGTGNDGKRKACKNCSCGLRELIESEEGASGAPPPPKSACGNCSLGDAYRCAGCPHRGKPAFVDGSEVKVADAMESFEVAGIDATHDEMLRKVEEQTAVNEARMQMALESVDHERIKIEKEAEQLQASELVKQFKMEMGLDSPAPVSDVSATGEKTIGKKVEVK